MFDIIEESNCDDCVGMSIAGGYALISKKTDLICPHDIFYKICSSNISASPMITTS